MFEAFRRILDDLTGDDDRTQTGDDDVRLAAAALLFHVMGIDGVASDDEAELLRGLLKRRFELGDTWRVNLRASISPTWMTSVGTPWTSDGTYVSLLI